MKKNTPPLQKKSSHNTLLKTVGSVALAGLLGAGMMAGGMRGIEPEEDIFHSLVRRTEEGLAKYISPERVEPTKKLLSRLEQDGTLGILHQMGSLNSLSRVMSENELHLRHFYDPYTGGELRTLVSHNLQRLKRPLLAKITHTTLQNDRPLTLQESLLFEDMVSRAYELPQSDIKRILTKVPLRSPLESYSMYDLFRDPPLPRLSQHLPTDDGNFLTYMMKGYRQDIRRLLLQNDVEFYQLLSVVAQRSDALAAGQAIYEQQFIRPFYEQVISLLEEIDQSEIEEKVMIAGRLSDILKRKQRDLQTFTQFAHAMSGNLDNPKYHRSLFSHYGTEHKFFDLGQLPLQNVFVTEKISRDALYIPL